MKKSILLQGLTACVILFLNGCSQADLATPENNLAAVELQNPEAHNFGWSPAPSEELAKIPFAPSLKVALPASASLHTPPVGNQGGQGSCVAWGTAYTTRSTLQHDKTGGAYDAAVNLFSPSFVYDQIKIKTCSGGSYVTAGLDLLVKEGDCTLKTMPYSDKDCSAQPNAAQLAQAATFKIKSYSRVNITAADIKTQIAVNKKVVIVAGPVDKAFEALGKNQVLTTYNSKQYLGGHCYAVVAYDDARQAFTIQNQWGTSWSTNGFAYIGYNIIGQLWQEAYVLNAL